MEVGRIGIWSIGLRSQEPQARGRIAEAAAELEELGYGAVWLGGSPGVEHARPLLEATSRIVVATGILNIWDHEAPQVAEQHLKLAREHPGRFLLGLGVGHAPMVGERYRRPYAAMMEFLDGLDSGGVPKAERVLAALGPKMLAAARDRAAGAHPYLVVPEHTREAREVLGDGPLLAPEVKVVLDTDLDRGRRAAREHLSGYLALPNYTNNLRRLGYGEEDFRDGGSDRLIDAVFAVGDVDAAERRITEHVQAGADHIAVQVIGGDRSSLPLEAWRALAPLTRRS
jgi:probable F420-dependent oxidoreductase